MLKAKLREFVEDWEGRCVPNTGLDLYVVESDRLKECQESKIWAPFLQIEAVAASQSLGTAHLFQGPPNTKSLRRRKLRSNIRPGSSQNFRCRFFF
jgi:hypothetical protein